MSVSYVMWSAALDSSHLLLSYSLMPLSSRITTILISTLFKHINISICLQEMHKGHRLHEFSNEQMERLKKLTLFTDHRTRAAISIAEYVLLLLIELCHGFKGYLLPAISLSVQWLSYILSSGTLESQCWYSSIAYTNIHLYNITQVRKSVLV